MVKRAATVVGEMSSPSTLGCSIHMRGGLPRCTGQHMAARRCSTEALGALCKPEFTTLAYSNHQLE